MNREEFKTAIEKLRRVYGEKNYPEDRVAEFWKEFSLLGDGIFRDAIAEAIHERYAPMKNTIHEHVQKVIRARNLRERSRKISRELSYEKKSYPWPAGILAVMEMIAAGKTEGAFTTALSFNKLSSDEAWKLYECYATQDFRNPEALEILNRVKPDSEAVRSLIQLATKQAETGLDSKNSSDPDT